MAMMVVGDGFGLFPAVSYRISADGLRAAPHHNLAS
jgi:hypothetical protein